MKLFERVPNPVVGGTAQFRYALVMTDKEAQTLRHNTRAIVEWCNDQFGLYGRDWSLYSGTDGFAIYSQDMGGSMLFALRWIGTKPEAA